jgi:c-di-GMP-binding flagellar brake protein YcgR
MTAEQRKPPTPLENQDDYSRYALESRTEIIFRLRELAMGGEMLAAYFNQGRDFILTTLLEVKPDHEIFIYDYGTNEELNQKLVDSEKIIFVGNPGGVRMQFICNAARKIKYGGRSAFISNIPRQMVRMQRREFYRVPLPLSKKLQCIIPNHNGERLELTVRDISVGGVSLVGDEHLSDAKSLDRMSRCRIVLDEFGEISCDLEIRHVAQFTKRNGGQETRLGCMFMGITPVMQAMIQRYMVHLEQERRALLEE